MPRGRESLAVKRAPDRTGFYASEAVQKRDRLYVRATSEQLERWKQTAAAAGWPSVSALVRDLLDAQPAERNVATRPGPESEEPDWLRNLEIIAAGGRRI
jgi:hypothetical protein